MKFLFVLTSWTWYTLIVELVVLGFTVVFIDGQTNEGNNCTKYFRDVRRSGIYMVGKLEMPTDANFPRYQLRLRFSKTIHSMTVRQLKARDSGTHKDFTLDPMEHVANGMMQLNVLIRMRSMMGSTPKLTRLIYNTIALCGEPVTNEELNDSIVIQIATTRKPVPVLIPILPAKGKNVTEDDYDDFDVDAEHAGLNSKQAIKAKKRRRHSM